MMNAQFEKLRREYIGAFVAMTCINLMRFNFGDASDKVKHARSIAQDLAIYTDILRQQMEKISSSKAQQVVKEADDITKEIVRAHKV